MVKFWMIELPEGEVSRQQGITELEGKLRFFPGRFAARFQLYNTSRGVCLNEFKMFFFLGQTLLIRNTKDGNEGYREDSFRVGKTETS